MRGETALRTDTDSANAQGFSDMVENRSKTTTLVQGLDEGTFLDSLRNEIRSLFHTIFQLSFIFELLGWSEDCDSVCRIS